MVPLLRVVVLVRASLTKVLLKRDAMTQCHVTIFGSNANNGTNASTFYWNWNNDSSNANRNIGAHVPTSLKKSWVPDPLVKYVANQSLVGKPKNSAGCKG